MVDVKALVDKARQEFDQPEPSDVPVMVGGEKVVLRFRPVRGTEWRDLVAGFPARTESVDNRTVVVQADRGPGFNTVELPPAYPGVAVVEGESEQVLSGDEWRDLHDVLSGPDLEHVTATIWGMNVQEPLVRLRAAGKASTGGQKKKRRSPASSASQSKS